MNISDARALAYRESVLKPCKIVELLMLKQQKRRIPEWECIWMQYRKSYKNECDLLLT